MVLSVVVLTGLVTALVWCVMVRTTSSAWILLALSSIWLPSNNGHLEGRTVLILTDAHAVTQADCVGIACWLVATIVLVWRAQSAAPPGRRPARAGAILLACGFVFAVGALAAFETG